MKRFVKTIGVDTSKSVARQLFGFLRGQYVYVNGMMARVVNHTGNRVVLWLLRDKNFAVFG